MNTTGPAEEVIVELRFPARPDRMTLVRSTVRGAAVFCGLDPATTQEIVLAVGEACQNVMQHAYTELNAGDILLTILRNDGAIVVRVTDFAPPIDLTKVRSRDFSEIRPGGLGVHFIEALMDSAVFRRGPGGKGNVLEMVKRVGVAA